MNRSIAFLGLGVLLLGLAFVAYPVVVGGREQVDPEQEVGLIVLSVSVSVLLWGMTSPDPRITTVPGWFGNPDENELRRTLSARRALGPARFRPSPRESVHCWTCYTLMPAQQVTCPRCGGRRSCRACGKPLFLLAGAVRCGPCVRDEVYCDCPRTRNPSHRRLGRHPRLQ